MADSAESLKIGLVLDSGLDKPDGVQQYVLTLGEWFRKQGHDVHYLVGETKRHDVPGIHSLSRSFNIRFNGNNGSIPWLTSKRKLKAFLAAENFDVLHVQVPHHPFLAQPLIMAAGPDTAIVGTFHIAPYNRLVAVANRLLGWWLKPSLKRFDKIVSVSTAAADFARQTFRIETDILPNVIDYRRFKTARPLATYANDRRLTILFLGRLVPRKGCLVLLKAAEQLLRRTDLPPFRVVICGKGPLEAELRDFVARHGLSEVVEFVGFIPEKDKPRYYASAELAVFPSRGGESFGIVLTEAMASGRPVVLAGDNPGYRSVMEPRAELLFEPDQPGILAQKLAHYMTHPDDRQVVKQWAGSYAKTFDVGVVGSQLLNIYRQALHKRRRT